MARLKVSNLPKDVKVSDEELKKAVAGLNYSSASSIFRPIKLQNGSYGLGKWVCEPCRLRPKDKVKAPSELFLRERSAKVLVIEPNMFKWAVIDEGLREYLEFFRVERSVDLARKYGVERERVQQLYNAGLLKVNGKLRFDFNFQKENSKKKLSLIVLHTSNACNFRCTYCYSNASRGRPMELDIAKRVLHQAVKLHDEPITIEFHGGEPLLHFEFIKSVVEYAGRFRRRDGSRKFFFTIQSNISLIDEGKINFLDENRIGIGISIDGPREFNDRTRLYPDGRGTYKDIVRGIKLLQSQKVSFGTIVVVSDINVVDHIYDFMMETEISRLKLNPYFNQGRAKGEMSVKTRQEEYAYKMLNLVDKVIEHNSNNNNRLVIENISILLNNIVRTERGHMCMRNPCGAGVSMIGIDIDGSTYPCEEMNGKKELIIGNVRNKSIYEMLNSPLIKLLRDREPGSIEDCGACEIRNVCSVSCANRSHNRTGGFFGKSELCIFFKILVPELMWRIYDNPDGVLTLLG